MPAPGAQSRPGNIMRPRASLVLPPCWHRRILWVDGGLWQRHPANRDLQTHFTDEQTGHLPRESRPVSAIQVLTSKWQSLSPWTLNY